MNSYQVGLLDNLTMPLSGRSQFHYSIDLLRRNHSLVRGFWRFQGATVENPNELVRAPFHLFLLQKKKISRVPGHHAILWQCGVVVPCVAPQTGGRGGKFDS